MPCRRMRGQNERTHPTSITTWESDRRSSKRKPAASCRAKPSQSRARQHAALRSNARCARLSTAGGGGAGDGRAASAVSSTNRARACSICSLSNNSECEMRPSSPKQNSAQTVFSIAPPLSRAVPKKVMRAASATVVERDDVVVTPGEVRHEVELQAEMPEHLFAIACIPGAEDPVIDVSTVAGAYAVRRWSRSVGPFQAATDVSDSRSRARARTHPTGSRRTSRRDARSRRRDDQRRRSRSSAAGRPRQPRQTWIASCSYGPTSQRPRVSPLARVRRRLRPAARRASRAARGRSVGSRDRNRRSSDARAASRPHSDPVE